MPPASPPRPRPRARRGRGPRRERHRLEREGKRRRTGRQPSRRCRRQGRRVKSNRKKIDQSGAPSTMWGIRRSQRERVQSLSASSDSSLLPHSRASSSPRGLPGPGPHRGDRRARPGAERDLPALAPPPAVGAANCGRDEGNPTPCERRPPAACGRDPGRRASDRMEASVSRSAPVVLPTSRSSTSRLKTGSLVYCAIPLPSANGKKARSRSRGRQPKSVVPSVITIASQPQALALRTKLATSSFEVLQ
jgi:hypothetical protein